MKRATALSGTILLFLSLATIPAYAQSSEQGQIRKAGNANRKPLTQAADAEAIRARARKILREAQQIIEAMPETDDEKRGQMGLLAETKLKAWDFSGAARYARFLDPPPQKPRPIPSRMPVYRSRLDTFPRHAAGFYSAGLYRLYVAMMEAGDRPALRKAAELAASHPTPSPPNAQPGYRLRPEEICEIACMQAYIGDIEGAEKTAAAILHDHKDQQTARAYALGRLAVARAQLRAGNKTAARKTLDQLAPDTCDLIVLAEVRAATGERLVAARLFFKAVDPQSPLDPEYIHEVVSAQRNTGDVKGALTTLHHALAAMSPKIKYDARRSIAEIQYELEDMVSYQETVKLMQDEARDAPEGQGGGWVRLKRVAEDQDLIGDHAGGMRTYKMAYQAFLNQNHTGYSETQAAELQQKTGDKSGAIARMRSLVQSMLKPNEPPSDWDLSNVGQEQCRLGDVAGGRETLAHIREPRARNELAYWLVMESLENGDLIGAHVVAIDPANGSPDDTGWRDTAYGNVLRAQLYEHKDFKAALNLMEAMPDKKARLSACESVATKLLNEGEVKGALRAAQQGLQMAAAMRREQGRSAASADRQRNDNVFYAGLIAHWSYIAQFAKVLHSLKAPVSEDRMLLIRLLREDTEWMLGNPPGQRIEQDKMLKLRATAADFAGLQLSLGDIEGAIKTFHSQPNMDFYIPNFANAQVIAGDVAGALRLAESTASPIGKARALIGAAEGLLAGIPEEHRRFSE